ncbi:hypothetical protein HID58_080375, partial [Brassica napus]
VISLQDAPPQQIAQKVKLCEREANWKFHTVFMAVEVLFTILSRKAEQTCRLDHSAPDDDGTACVPITKQPASDNPFLKNHKIQMKPNYYPERFFDDNKVSSTKSGKEDIYIPQTIPMRRTKEDDFLRANMARRRNELSHFLNLLNLTSLTKEHEHDITYVDVDKNYGAKATTNAWEPKIKINKQNEFIFSQIWLLSDLFGQYLISIEAGWQPNLYGDNNTRLSLTGL